jgi:3-dehydroquinate dehydratase II
MHRILVVNGPNLNALGRREPEIYGEATWADIQVRLERLGGDLGCRVESLQSNHEGVLIDALYGAVERSDGVLLNAGALTHTSVALRDAVVAAGLPVVEVHLTNPNAREPFRHPSLLSGVTVGVIQGFGADSYLLALRALSGFLDRGR